MTDETTPGDPMDSGTPVEPEAPIPSEQTENPTYPEESAVPVDAAQHPESDTPAEPAAPVEGDVPAEPETSFEAEMPVEDSAAAPASQPAVAPMSPASPGLGPVIASGSRVVVMVSRGPSPTPPAAYINVPQVTGMAQGDALARLQEAGLPSQVFNDYHEKLPRGEVVGQLPAPGTSVPSGSESVLIVSSGPAAASTITTALPNVVGLAESDAVSRLQAVGLSPQLVREYSSSYPDGVVIAQLPNSSSLIDMPKKRSLIWLWIVLAVLLVAALGVGGYLYLNRTGVVPVVVGLTQADATTAIESAGFKLGNVETTQTLKASEVGKVVAQSPAANSESKMTAGIDIVVSGGQKLLDVPSVTGKTQADAEAALKDAGLKASVTQGYSSTVVKGIVISQAPEAGQKIPSETSVGIVVSEGAQNVTVPGLSGQTQSQAKAALSSLGLGLQTISNYSSTPKGEVSEQFPAAGTAVPPGTIVGLVMSLGSTSAPTSSTVPAVVGRTSSDAETAIKNANLRMVAVQWTGTGKPPNEVVGQIPDSNTLVQKDSQVMVFVSNGK